ncbi:MAG: NADH:flavin oxidoreductase/NADH oxidase family protein [Gammaproteobacteria bacterium]|nr:NADH:flavin oxidoreductase/NADH oxidase family protein [Gammaproteobacteria bacterium]
MTRPTPATPLDLPCGARLPNRLMKAAMTEGLADAHGRSTARLETLYRRWSQGGAGLLVTGNVMVDRRYLERPGNLVVDNNDALESLRGLAAAGTSGGNHLWMQISHPGRQCSRIVNNHPVAPSAVQLRILGNFARPRALQAAEIPPIVESYAQVAEQARLAGFTGVQIHGAHGYLASQFLSPLTNQRTDDWGGSLQNRARFLLDIVAATRQRVGDDFPVAVKLNSADFQKGGFDLDDSATVAGWLEQAGIDLLEISGGTYERPRLLGLGADEQPEQRSSTRAREAYFLDYAQTIRKATSLPLAVTGGIRDYEFMREAIGDKLTDVIGLARPLCVEPDLPLAFFSGDRTEARRDEQHLRLGRGILRPTSPVGAVRALNAQGAAAWYYRQIIRLADGLDADPELGFARALRQHFFDEYRLGLRRRRVLDA